MLKWRRKDRLSLLEDIPKIKGRVVWRSIEEDKPTVIALDMESGFLYTFQDASARIWQLCDGERTISQIINVIQQEFPRISQKDVIKFINELKEDGLIELHDNMRRQKKILASSFKINLL